MTTGGTASKGTTGTKVDLKKQRADLYYPSANEVTVVEVPTMPFLMIDGAGNPNTSQEYQQALEALYAVAYALKFLLKKEQEVDYAVMPLPGGAVVGPRYAGIQRRAQRGLVVDHADRPAAGGDRSPL